MDIQHLQEVYITEIMSNAKTGSEHPGLSLIRKLATPVDEGEVDHGEYIVYTTKYGGFVFGKQQNEYSWFSLVSQCEIEHGQKMADLLSEFEDTGILKKAEALEIANDADPQHITVTFVFAYSPRNLKTIVAIMDKRGAYFNG